MVIEHNGPRQNLAKVPSNANSSTLVKDATGPLMSTRDLDLCFMSHSIDGLQLGNG